MIKGKIFDVVIECNRIDVDTNTGSVKLYMNDDRLASFDLEEYKQGHTVSIALHTKVKLMLKGKS